MANCPFCQKPARDDGSIIHHGNCSGLDRADINNLQHDMLTTRIRELEAAAKLASAAVQTYLATGAIEPMKLVEAGNACEAALKCSQSDAATEPK